MPSYPHIIIHYIIITVIFLKNSMFIPPGIFILKTNTIWLSISKCRHQHQTWRLKYSQRDTGCYSIIQKIALWGFMFYSLYTVARVPSILELINLSIFSDKIHESSLTVTVIGNHGKKEWGERNDAEMNCSTTMSKNNGYSNKTTPIICFLLGGRCNT
jgi:hypothetical protein